MSRAADIKHGVMGAYKRGTLRTSTGALVATRRQAVRIALVMSSRAGEAEQAPHVSPRLAELLQELGADAPELARKCQPAELVPGRGETGYLFDIGPASADHRLAYAGREGIHAAEDVYTCQICGLVVREVGRGRTKRRFFGPARDLVEPACRGRE